MKYINSLFILLFCLLAIGCKDNVAAGAGALGDDDEVRVCVSTFSGISSLTDSISNFYITQTPDSFLIGECNTDDWATIKADLLAQFACPIGTQFPDSTTIDSIALVMTYSSWFGDGNGPLRFSVYEMDRNTFSYDSVYTSQLPINSYWSGEDSTHAVVADRVIVAAQNADTIYSSTEERTLPYIRFMMNDRFVQKMNRIKRFPASQELFNQYFKGLYITTTYGSSTALYVDNITMIIYYHYFYKSEDGTYRQMKDTKFLYANSEVRQVNRYSFPYKDVVVAKLQSHSDSLNYVISPSYVYTVLSVPIGQYVQQINDSMVRAGGKESLYPFINKARMRVDVTNIDAYGTAITRWAKPANDMLLIDRDSVQNFFQNNQLPSSEYCLFSTLTYGVDSAYHYYYYYEFDVSSILHRALRAGADPASVLNLVMVPVDVEYTTTTSSGSTVISKVKINQTITFTILRSAQDSDNPMDVDVVYSGFSLGNL